MTASIHQIVTFADNVFAGNPAFVLVNDAPLPQERLQQVARQLREAVLTEISGGGDGGLQLRFSTPTGPHAGAGHAAHAAAYVALHRLFPQADRIDFRLADGKTMTALRTANGPSVEWPIMPFEPTPMDGLEASIGVRPAEAYAAPFGLVAVLDSAAEVAAIVPDLERIAALAANTLTVTARDQGGDFVIRVFAPRLGLPEDPVCGTAHRIIVPMWGERLGKQDLVSRQLSPRGGTLFCHLGKTTVTLAGAAVPFMSGHLLVDL